MILEETFDTKKYVKIDSKRVKDSDGFYTDYTMYYNPDEDNFFFIFGDEDVYGPDPDYADWTCDTDDEAIEWYDNYNGFEDEDLDESVTTSLKEGKTQFAKKPGEEVQFSTEGMTDVPDVGERFKVGPLTGTCTKKTADKVTMKVTANAFLQEDINDVLPAEDIEIVADVEPSKETVTAGPDAGVAGLINNLIIQNWGMNSAYTDLIVNADANNQPNIANLAKDIVADINNHIGKLQAALAMLSPNVENIAAGESEAAQQLTVVNEELTEKEQYTLERTGKINERIRRKLNSIVNRYNGWQEPAAIGKMFGELADEGVDVTVMGPPQDYAPGAKSWTVPWELDGVRVENSMFVYSVYEGGKTPRNEYNMYFS